MGTTATRYFDQAEELAGLRGKIRLAVLARVTSTEAATGADSPDLLGRLSTALDTLRAEVGARVPRPGEAPVPHQSRPPAATDRESVLRSYQRAYLELMTQRSLFLGDVATTVRRITEAASHTLDIERVSVWFVDEGVTRITCADLYQRAERQHSSGTELFARDFEPYFRALREQRTIAASDAHTDPRTSCFSAPYLTPLGIHAMLDVPIWVSERMVGVICHEHLRAPRVWTPDEETFANLMSCFVALALENERAMQERRTFAPPEPR